MKFHKMITNALPKIGDAPKMLKTYTLFSNVIKNAVEIVKITL